MIRNVFILFACVYAFASAADLSTEISSPGRFSSGDLFERLDSAGGGGTWMELDPEGVIDPEIGKILVDGRGNIFPDVEHGWFLETQEEKNLFAVLRKKGPGESLSFYRIPKFTAKKIPLRIRELLDPQKVFRDYRETLAGHFVHLDDTNLQVVVREDEIQFSYLRPDREALVPSVLFDRLPESRKAAEIQARRDFYAYEYVLMVRAFLGSTRGLFNWQVWHWLSRDLTSDGMIGEREIAAVLASPEQGKFVRIFFRNLAGGYTVEMLSNAHGAFLFKVRRK